VALGSLGGLAAGTAKGGMTAKRYGRIGDSPVFGASTWADDRCAFSGTGWGEFYLRSAAAHALCARLHYLNESPVEAGHAVINGDVPALGGATMAPL
jgi:L-asparaginase / beta-aspartyl-peptidase